MAGRGARSPPPGPAHSAIRRRRHPPGKSRLLRLRRVRAARPRRPRLRRPGTGCGARRARRGRCAATRAPGCRLPSRPEPARPRPAPALGSPRALAAPGPPLSCGGGGAGGGVEGGGSYCGAGRGGRTRGLAGGAGADRRCHPTRLGAGRCERRVPTVARPRGTGGGGYGMRLAFGLLEQSGERSAQARTGRPCGPACLTPAETPASPSQAAERGTWGPLRHGLR